MPLSPPSSTPARSAADVDAAIRELWTDGVLPEERRSEYEQLLVEWARAYQAERAGRGGTGLAA